MAQIYGNVTKVLVDSTQGSNLRYLPLDKILQQSAAESSAAVAPSAPSAPATAPAPNDSRGRDGSRTR